MKLFILYIFIKHLSWGVGASGTLQQYLTEIEIPILTDSACRAAGPVFDTYYQPSQMVCAGVGEGGVCQGDSGGSLIVRDIHPGSADADNCLLIGLTSWGDNQCGKTPGVFTRITAFLSWIQSTITANS